MKVKGVIDALSMTCLATRRRWTRLPFFRDYKTSGRKTAAEFHKFHRGSFI